MKKAIEVKGFNQLDKSKMVKINGGVADESPCGTTAGDNILVCTESVITRGNFKSEIVYVKVYVC